MTAFPPMPSLPPIVMQELRREALKAALQLDGLPDKSLGTVMNAAKVVEGFILFGDAEHAWRHAGFRSVADAIAAERAAGRAATPDDVAALLPANVATLRPKG
ncbi:hypothetical protein TSH58p_17595 [Azospirillum sp. TSH58]|uniref:hypothetical protein n=1 Tax=Azospirillum sp. TSH58 TaxID=664962 RepID=UPI000D5FF047|nr:hypothetical protein [Azospirillum sp. TSH58]AWJ82647.1 hypothetical protein TSH58p_03415 [Azospirillum sp. TSH58]AWJ85178.1 hypothetical protein TSH58p_17595 [Azospirillum sp. TSH58]PWC80849.1 hypothetical protein TSH58_00990 [Azospirillum sp. TSH58]